MPSIRELRAIRRHNLAALIETYGQAELSRDTGIPTAYLYHMSKAVGKQARGVNDDNVQIIETAAGLDRGWLDIDRRGAQPVSLTAEIKAVQLRRRHAWPFKTVSRERFEALDEADKLRVEAAALKALVAAEREHPSGKRKVS